MDASRREKKKQNTIECSPNDRKTAFPKENNLDEAHHRK